MEILSSYLSTLVRESNTQQLYGYLSRGPNTYNSMCSPAGVVLMYVKVVPCEQFTSLKFIFVFLVV